MDIVIRNIQHEDIPDVVEIRINGWKSAYRNIISNDYLNSLDIKYEDMIAKMEKDYMDHGFVVAESDGEIVGYCRFIYDNSNSPAINDADCELTCLYIKPELKRCGIGTKLFEHVLNELKIAGKKKMVLWCFSYIEPSKKFYTKMGGKIIAERYKQIDGTKYKESCFMYDL